MKQFIVFVAFLAVAYGQTPSQKLESKILALRDQMPCGFPDMGIPVLAPFKGDYFNLFHKMWILKINGTATDFTINGLNDFDILNVNLNVLTLKLNVELRFNNLQAVGKYNIKSFIIGLLKPTGFGKFDIKTSDLRVKLYARVGMVDGVLRMMDLDLGVALDGMKSRITGLTGPLGTLIVSSVFDKTVQNYVADNEEAITDNIREMALPGINEVLKDYTVSDILGMLQSRIDPPPCVA